MDFFWIGLNRKYRRGEYVKCTNNLVADKWTAYLTRGKVVEDDGKRIKVKVLERSSGSHDVNATWWMQRQLLRPLYDDHCCGVDISLFE